jgi:hypothetical protein
LADALDLPTQDMTNPLDNRRKELPDEATRGSFQYFLKVVPTEYTFLSASRITTNQFSATEHFRELTPVSDKGLPSAWFPPSFQWRLKTNRLAVCCGSAVVSFSYTFSPIMFRIEQYRVGFLQFLTSVCAIVGGVFTVRSPSADASGARRAYSHTFVLLLLQILGIMDSLAFGLLNKTSSNTLL